MVKIIFQTLLDVKYEKEIKNYIKYLLHALNIQQHLNIVVTGDKRIQKLHKKYFNYDTTTDVISFHSYGIKNFLGEVVINIEFAKRECEKRKMSLGEELCRYVTHGVLHILGYRDDKSKFKKIMWRKQEELLKKYFIKNI